MRSTYKAVDGYWCLFQPRSYSAMFEKNEGEGRGWGTLDGRAL